MSRAQQGLYQCQYGAQGDVRGSYAHLPWQSLWTWLTGKALAPAEDAQPAPARGERFLLAHLLFTWSAMAALVLLGQAALSGALGQGAGLLLVPLGWVLMVNRLRSLQATFHYLTHGAVLKDKQRAQRYARWFLTTPLLYQDWHTYNQSHVREHHNIHVLCSAADPDQRFIEAQGFYLGMPEWLYWWRVVSTPFHPVYLLRQWRETLRDNLQRPPRAEVLFRLSFWALLLGALWALGGLQAFALMYALPRAVLFEHSMWLQLFTEHLWFYQPALPAGAKQRYGYLTWGRFQGRRPPREGGLAMAGWLLRGLLCDLPVRLYIYPQDLPNHDAHHRRPNVHFCDIARYRASAERQPSSYGPWLEVWGFVAGLQLIRDHLCRGVQAPFTLRDPQPTAHFTPPTCQGV
ncbi:hypothetical protein SFA35_18890 [Pseudomonas sp. HR96]|uniref:hypothetical protein n=1 Tax=Pseudomonas sp. HR96 TaxID=1027966 RepID=UPI002A747F5A|nr:hypothetical protein [Pseudomonas sp. HR96]WPO98686.1 hypothetical protein SFA35_18890 [Pseudomonas sp. HR96]